MKVLVRSLVFGLGFLAIDFGRVLFSALFGGFSSFVVGWKAIGGYDLVRVLITIALGALCYSLLVLDTNLVRVQRLKAVVPAISTSILLGWIWFGPLLTLMQPAHILAVYGSFFLTIYLVLGTKPGSGSSKVSK